jgi:predicted glutamate--cysteine ligase
VRLSKGFEIEVYTGNSKGEIIGLSDRIVRDLDGFVREPDNRNVEYTTAPLCNYDRLFCAILRPRRDLRHYLTKLGDFTLIPGSCLSLGDSNRFFRSDPQNPYHTYIEHTYGTNVVTASIHLNIGISNPEKLIQAYRLVRMEAPLFLALSASSPFLDNQITGYHSTRWFKFPQTPTFVPLFTSHHDYIQWVEQQLELGTMQNVRHLWCSVRPNGDNRPYHLNRLELRICDLVLNPIQLLAITALLEARLWQVLEDDSLDPLIQSTLSSSNLNAELVKLTLENEQAVARHSLDANLIHWQNGREITAQDWIKNLTEEVLPIAKQRGFACFLTPIYKLIREGNQAQQWLKQYQQGMSIKEIIQGAIKTTWLEEQDLEDKLCQSVIAA